MKTFFLIIFVALGNLYCNAQCDEWNSSPTIATFDSLIPSPRSVCFTDVNTGYAVGNSGKIVKTINAGTSWVTLTSGTTSHLYSVYFTDANTGYAVGDAGIILKTTNAGGSWTPLVSGTTNPLTDVYFADVNTGYAVGGQGRILKTTNAGVNWTTLTSGTTQFFYSVCFTDTNTGYAVGAAGTILKTINAGSNWTTLTSGTTRELYSVYFTDVNTGYAVGQVGAILKTTNAGSSWTTLTSGTTSALLSVYFTNANTGYAVGVSGTILKTINAGSNWTTLTSGTMAYLASVYFPDANTGYAVGYGGAIILKTTNAGGNWTKPSSKITNWLNSVYFTDANTGYAVGDSGKIVKTTNAGTTWVPHISGTTRNLNSVYFINANTGYAVGAGGTILKTINAGSSWTTLTSGITTDLRSIYFTDINTGYAVGTAIRVTRNAGASCSYPTTFGGGEMNSVYFTDANTGYAVGESGYVKKTTDAGDNWTLYTLGTTGTTSHLYSVYFTDANTGYAVGYLGTILKTINAGNSWTTLTSGTTRDLRSVYFTDANTGYAVGQFGTIIKTTNAGTSWTTLVSGTTNHLTSVYFADASSGYAVGNSGTILKTQLLLPETPNTITGTTIICQGQSPFTYNVPTITNATSYIWTLPSGVTGTSTTNSITVNYGASAVSGNITVKGHNSCGDGAISTLPITVNPLLATAGTISGATTACQGQNSVTYNVPTIANATSYIWTLPTGVTGTSTTNSITVNYGASAVSGNITVKGHNDCGDGAIATLPITVNPLVANAGTISGAATTCQGQNSVTYNVPTIPNATSYIWTLPNGVTGTSTTNSITVNYGASAVSGNITVKGHNDCGDGAIATLPITVNPLVASAGTISGVATACQGQNSATYNVPTIANATSYIWTLPNGATGTSATNSITVNYGASAVSGNITVKGHNSCGDGAISTLPITVNPLPSSAGNISGTSTICLPENAVTYTVPTISNATSYIWTLPNGASGTSTTNSISVTYGTATTGNITVKGHNDCGDGAISTLPITITQTPPTPTISNIGNNVLSSSSTSGNQWYNQNGIINGAVSQNYTVTANGSFYVIVKVGDCYSDSSSHIQITNTGIENNNSNDVFSIYPNPTKNSLNITVNQKLIGSEFTITDQLGRTVITGKLTAENTVVEVGNLSNGIYLLRIGTNVRQTFKVVKE